MNRAVLGAAALAGAAVWAHDALSILRTEQVQEEAKRALEKRMSEYEADPTALRRAVRFGAIAGLERRLAAQLLRKVGRWALQRRHGHACGFALPLLCTTAPMCASEAVVAISLGLGADGVARDELERVLEQDAPDVALGICASRIAAADLRALCDLLSDHTDGRAFDDVPGLAAGLGRVSSRHLVRPSRSQRRSRSWASSGSGSRARAPPAPAMYCTALCRLRPASRPAMRRPRCGAR